MAGGSDLGAEESDVLPVESDTGGASCRFVSVGGSWRGQLTVVRILFSRSV